MRHQNRSTSEALEGGLIWASAPLSASPKAVVTASRRRTEIGHRLTLKLIYTGSAHKSRREKHSLPLRSMHYGTRAAARGTAIIECEKKHH
eukprot:4014978-Pleurochrysis_carterae.AAC.2